MMKLPSLGHERSTRNPPSSESTKGFSPLLRPFLRRPSRTFMVALHKHIKELQRIQHPSRLPRHASNQIPRYDPTQFPWTTKHFHLGKHFSGKYLLGQGLFALYKKQMEPLNRLLSSMLWNTSLKKKNQERSKQPSWWPWWSWTMLEKRSQTSEVFLAELQFGDCNPRGV